MCLCMNYISSFRLRKMKQLSKMIGLNDQVGRSAVISPQLDLTF